MTNRTMLLLGLAVVLACAVATGLVVNWRTAPSYETKPAPPPVAVKPPPRAVAPPVEVVDPEPARPEQPVSTANQPQPRPVKPPARPPVAPAPVYQPPPVADPVVTEARGRVALSFVGADADANQVWLSAINDPTLPDESRQNLIEDL